MSVKESNFPYRRVVIIIVLLICILSSCVYFYFWGEANKPSIKYITTHPEEFDNTTIVVLGRIIGFIQLTSIDNSTPNALNKNTTYWVLTIETSGIELDIIVEASQLNADPKYDDLISCKGIYHQDNTLEAVEIHLTDPFMANLIIGRSIAAIPVLILILLLTWKFNLKKFMFETRKRW